MPAVAAVELDLGVRRLRRAESTVARVVADHHDVALFAVLEVVEQAVFLHQAADEMFVGLVVLDNVVFRQVGLRGPEFVSGQAAVIGGKDLRQDVHHACVLEDPGIGAALQEGQPGNDFGVVEGEAAIRAGEAEHIDVAVDEMLAAVGQPYADADVLAQQVLQVNAGALGQQPQCEAVRGGQGRLPRQRFDQQGLVAFQRGIEAQQAAALVECGEGAAAGRLL